MIQPKFYRTEFDDSTIERIRKELSEVEVLFHKALGSRPRSVQRIWFKRLLSGRNFSILAPTGMGKSTFIAISALYFASKGKKSLIILPTKVLVKQTYERLKEMAERAGIDAKIVAYGLTKNNNKAKEKIKNGDFDILVVTSTFITFHVDKGLKLLDVVRDKFKAFDLVLVDDVDAILKGSKNVGRILKLLGLKDTVLNELKEASWEKLNELRARIENRDPEYTVGKVGQLVVSTATGRVGRRARELFRILNFSVGSSREGVRNVIDAYMISKEPYEDVISIAKRLKDGILIFLPTGKREEIKTLIERLNAAGIAAGGDSDEDIERFANGELNALVGVAYYYGRLVRGLDLPERSKYAIFIGIPKFRISYGDKPTIGSFMALGFALLPALIRKKEYADIRRRLRRTLTLLQRLSMRTRTALSEALSNECDSDDQFVKGLCERMNKIRKELIEIIKSDPETIDKYTGVVIIPGERLIIEIPDTRTYIQASGRTSRMYTGGITKGLSIVIETDESLLRKFIARTRTMFDVRRYKLEGDKLTSEKETLSLDEVIKEIERERSKIREILTSDFDPVKPVLFIVESPNKARTIASFFGRPGRIRLGPVSAYEVMVGDKLLIITATGGHVFDLIESSKIGEDDEYFGVIYKDGLIVPKYAPIIRCRYRISRITYTKTQISRVKPDCYLAEPHKETLEETREYVVLDPNEACVEDLSDEDYQVKLVEKLDKKEIVDALRRLAFETENVYIATDPDIEGEFIGRSVSEVIRKYAKEIKRAEFHEVTLRAILEALENPKEINMSRVYAQIVRRIEDRRIGFGLSRRLQNYFASVVGDCKNGSLINRILQVIEDALNRALERKDAKKASEEFSKKINAEISHVLEGKYKAILLPGTVYTLATEVCAKVIGQGMSRKGLSEKLRERLSRLIERRIYSLSAGRVQTPVLGRIKERSEDKAKVIALTFEIEERPGEKLTLYFGGYNEENPEEAEEMRSLAQKLFKKKRDAMIFLERKKASDIVSLSPPSPYTTDAMLADAARLLGFSPEKTMRIAQDLFEFGLITYHRTDSTRVSQTGISIAREYIEDRLGKDLFKPRAWEPTGPGVQGAHECIRPTRAWDVDDLRTAINVGDINPPRPLTVDHYRLYDMIFRRFIASQMREEQGVKVEYILNVSFGRVHKEIKIYEAYDVEEPKGRSLIRRIDDRYKRLFEGYSLLNLKIASKREFYDLAPEDRIVSRMRQRGIGRPSTYAMIVAKIKEKKYAIPIEFGKTIRLKITDRGRIVYEMITNKFGEMVSEERTRELMRKMSMIENNEITAEAVLEELFKEFREKILKELRRWSWKVPFLVR